MTKLLAFLMLSASLAVAPAFAADKSGEKSSPTTSATDKGKAAEKGSMSSGSAMSGGSMDKGSSGSMSSDKGSSGSMASDKGSMDKSANSQQNKMKDCQAQAGEKKLEGKDRQAFVNTCLKAKPAADTKAMSNSEKMSMCNKKTAGLKGDDRKKAQSDCMKGA
jgi:hypothetical protein